MFDIVVTFCIVGVGVFVLKVTAFDVDLVVFINVFVLFVVILAVFSR